MEAALKASEGQLRSMVDNAPYGIYRTIVEEGGKFAFVNPAMVKMLGYDSLQKKYWRSTRKASLQNGCRPGCRNRRTALGRGICQLGTPLANEDWQRTDNKRLRQAGSGGNAKAVVLQFEEPIRTIEWALPTGDGQRLKR